MKLTQKEIDRFWSYVQKTKDCWEWKGSTRKGYASFNIGGKTKYSYRISFFLSFGEFDESKLVCHKCDNPTCVNPDHLFLGTNQDNVDDRVKKGRSARVIGEKNGLAKLNKEAVSRIRKLYTPHKRDGLVAGLAKEYGVAPRTIYQVINKLSWAQ